MDAFSGTWSLHSSEGFDEYMKVIGVNFVTRKAASVLKPKHVLSIDDGLVTWKTVSSFKNTCVTFHLDEPFDEVTPDGREVKTTVSFADGKFTMVQKGDVTSEMYRELKDKDTMLITLKAGDVTCTRVYKRDA